MPRRLLALVVPLLLLAGCGADPDPKVAPTPSVPVSTSASPAAETADTSEQAIQQWSTLEIEMQNSGDSSRYRRATPDCAACQKFADLIDGYYAAGGYVRISGQVLTTIAALSSSGNRSAFKVSVDPEPTEFLRSAGSEVQHLPGDPLVFKVTLERSGGGWVMRDYVQLVQ